MQNTIHIATVHWHSGEWIDIQQKYFRDHITTPYRVYAWLNDIAPPHPGTFYYVRSEPIREHAVKLNLLAEAICLSDAPDNDILIFIDGDAFPVADLGPFLAEKLSAYKLAAIQRLDNNGDIQPHPCFCATTVGFWREIKGDWTEGHQWQDVDGLWINDVGGNLLKQLIDRNIDWHPMLRSNKKNLHPLLFGVYDSLIYHHGAGFRDPMTRIDIRNLKAAFGESPPEQSIEDVKSTNRMLSAKVFASIRNDAAFIKDFI